MSQKETNVTKAFEIAVERYAALGVDVKKSIDTFLNLSLSLHCWQADDVAGFETADGDLSGGIQVTGNYPGKARNMDELRDDILKATAFLPGKHRLSLHAIYADYGGQRVDRDAIGPEHFTSWMDWAKEHGLKLDFNSTSFSHPLSGNLTLSNPDPAIRRFWVEHHKRCREIADAMGRYQNDTSIMNLWIHDGSKEVPASRLYYRQLLESSLDEIFSVSYTHMFDALEAKLFGIGLESYTVGSFDFYLGYGAKKGKMLTLDAGHFHPTESIADKLSSLLLFSPGVMLHVSRPVRWDSDHVVRLDDEIKEIAKEIIRNDAADKVLIGLDFFDASINRLAAWIIGTRNMQKALMMALLEDNKRMKEDQENENYTHLLAYSEEMKTLPWQEVWNEYLRREGLKDDFSWFDDVMKYEKEVLSKRG